MPKRLLPSVEHRCTVDNVSGHGYLSFMDAFSGYNQIRMHPSDEDKIAFMSEVTNYCYKVMPFSLKNVGATYQKDKQEKLKRKKVKPNWK